MSSLPRRDGRKHCGLADGLPWPPGSASPLCPRASVARQHCFRHALHWGFAPPRLALSYLCNRRADGPALVRLFVLCENLGSSAGLLSGAMQCGLWLSTISPLACRSRTALNPQPTWTRTQVAKGGRKKTQDIVELFLVLICCVFVCLCVCVFVRLCVAVWVGALALVWATRFEAEWATAKKP